METGEAASDAVGDTLGGGVVTHEALEFLVDVFKDDSESPNDSQ